MTHLTPDQDKIYVFPNGETKPIKLVYENYMLDKDSCTINFKYPISGTFSFDDCTLYLHDNLLEKYYGVNINGKNIKPDASHFKSLL